MRIADELGLLTDLSEDVEAHGEWVSYVQSLDPPSTSGFLKYRLYRAGIGPEASSEWLAGVVNYIARGENPRDSRGDATFESGVSFRIVFDDDEREFYEREFR